MDTSINITVPPELEHLKGQELTDALAAHSAELANMEEEFVRYRVYERAYATGALANSVKGTAGNGSATDGGVLLATITANPEAETGRNYAPYQEGPPLGLPTYTNAPRHFLADVDPDDIFPIMDWVERSLKNVWLA